MTTALEGGEGSASRPGRSLLPGKTRYPLYRRLGGPQDRSGQVRKISPPPGFDPRTVQSVASRYTDWATRPTFREVVGIYFESYMQLINTHNERIATIRTCDIDIYPFACLLWGYLTMLTAGVNQHRVLWEDDSASGFIENLTRYTAVVCSEVSPRRWSEWLCAKHGKICSILTRLEPAIEGFIAA